ncbi:hypothetical protein BJ741DRAFT_632644 [Chytriomyces cf. hyalinus JEL632]|nr:hypothetical protein BJ741DRAFT_632644 [Chytriomyces cf. hyalinus JEL632]
MLHSYAHGIGCQMRYGPKAVMGGGTCDFEEIERVWSFLTNHIGRTQRQTHENRQDAIVQICEKLAVTKGRGFVRTVQAWFQNSLKEALLIAEEANLVLDGNFQIQPYSHVICKNKAWINQCVEKNTHLDGVTSGLANEYLGRKSTIVQDEAVVIWSGICATATSLKENQLIAKSSKGASKKAAKLVKNGQTLYAELQELVNQFNALPNNMDAANDAISTTDILSALSKDAIFQVLGGNSNAIQE